MTMLTVRKRTERTSASARCSKFGRENRVVIFNSAIIFIKIFLLVLFFSSSASEASSAFNDLKMKVSGIPEWLEPAVTRSLGAVWAEMPDAQNIDRRRTLEIVASRLFTGYRVEILNKHDEFAVNFFLDRPEDAPNWSIKIIEPELRGMTLKWFKADIAGFEGEVFNLIRELPAVALSWADKALKERLLKIIAKRLPGWDFSIQASLNAEGANFTLLFRPSPPLVLAIAPSLYSRTIPAMFRSDLEAKLIPGLSPLIGLPVAWAERHKLDIEKAAGDFLEDRNSVDNMKASASVNFKPGPVSNLEAKVDSDRFLFQVWVAAYAGINDKYPEAGVFFGWNTKHLTGLNLEFYAEALLELNDWAFTGRVGARTEIFHDLWAGVEGQWPDNLLFARIYWGSTRAKRPYAWWRWNHELGHEGALGYKIDEHISIEIYYDGTKSDKVGLRGQWSL